MSLPALLFEMQTKKNCENVMDLKKIFLNNEEEERTEKRTCSFPSCQPLKNLFKSLAF